MRFLVQLLLPIYDNEGQIFGADVFAQTRAELIERFGGVTAHTRAPARGLWVTDDGEVSRDDVVLFEVMAEELDRSWWTTYRKTLKGRFRQDEIVVRALNFEPL